ncbi:MAG: sulfotransferase domain-containing protein [Anaerolineales bacterium]|nr:sulfotransferase domain-containing protein [Anaerolineales bacterium]
MKSILKGIFKSKSEPIIIVSGLPRSGTSMVMKMLEAGGISPLTDHIRSADDDNPKGYYEFERAKKLKEGDVAWLPEAQGKVVKLIGALLVELPPNYEYRVLFMRRKIEEVLASQTKMLERRGEEKKIDDDTMAVLFQKHIKQVEDWMDKQSNLRYLEVDYNAMLEDPLPQVEQIKRFLGGELDEAAMTAVVDPELYRQRK